MPASSSKQRMLMGLAEHHPEQVSRKNRGVLKMSKGQLHDFAATKGLKHDTAPPGGFAHMGTTVEGPDFRGAKRAGKTFATGDHEDAPAFAHAGTTREGPRWQGAAKAGPTVGSMGSYPEAHGFKNAGSSKEGPDYAGCLSSASADRYPGTVTRPRIRRAKTSREHSGGSPDGFRTHTKPSPREDAGATSHYGTDLAEAQDREVNTYAAGREKQGSPTIAMGVKSSPSPTPPGREQRHAFKMSTPEEHLKGKKWIAGAVKHPGALTRAAQSHGVSKRAEAQRESHSANRSTRARGALGLRFMGGGDLHRGRRSA